MERGAIPIVELAGGLDLQSTLESGQTYLWRRRDGAMYASTGAYGGNAWYYTVVDGEVIHARQSAGQLEWEATTDAVPYLEELLRLDDDLPAIIEASPSDTLIETAYDTYQGMRIVRDPFFPCLISFICSAQMRVERIFEMQTALREAYGPTITVDGTTYHGFPSPDRLAEATEAELRELGLGYRAPYVAKTAALVADGAQPPDTLPTDYEAARDAMQVYVGVGEKVADCVLLFSQGYLEAIPLDTWIRTAIEEYYPDCDRGSYTETSRALRTAFGPYAGYTQTYVFHYLRHHH
ncbi:MAG: DNA glycosylase [Halobacteriales archaeon]|nr:DNA glycosylase [Halobacteriales archaeon]